MTESKQVKNAETLAVVATPHPIIQDMLTRFKLDSIGEAYVNPKDTGDITSRLWLEVWMQLTSLEDAIRDLNILLERVIDQAAREREQFAGGIHYQDWATVYAAKIPEKHRAVSEHVASLLKLHSYLQA
jgi:hypothetical protein